MSMTGTQTDVAAGDTESAAESDHGSGRYDPGLRRQATRKQRERGCSIYIASAELERAGIALDGPPPFYRVWGTSRGGVFVRLYKDR